MAGVFINYRVVDNPLGAAGIHEALASRFGKERVFRDCVSLAAGDHYPETIRTALAEADVLVSIIGPRWLTLTDGAGHRLIDRDHDWVRRELAWAHEKRTPVVPVLLVDTPDRAHPPMAHDLPQDLRWLANLQAFEFSQLRFGADLDRLADRLTALAPTLRRGGRDPGSLPPPMLAEVVTALEAVPCMMNENTRTLLVGQLRPTISGAIPHYPQRRAHVMSILNTCLNYERGIAELVATIAGFEQADSLPFQHLLATLRRLLPGTAFEN